MPQNETLARLLHFGIDFALMANLLNLLILLFKAVMARYSGASPDRAIDSLPAPKQPISPVKEVKMKIQPNHILMSRITENQLTTAQRDNLKTLVDRVNALLAAYTGPVSVSSGYRSSSVNSSVGGAAKSWHLQCAAVDLVDADGSLWKFCLENLELCADIGLWLEDKRWTPTWVHLQIYPPGSGARIFRPNEKPPAKPGAWDGAYDRRLDSKIVIKN